MPPVGSNLDPLAGDVAQLAGGEEIFPSFALHHSGRCLPVPAVGAAELASDREHRRCHTAAFELRQCMVSKAATAVIEGQVHRAPGKGRSGL